MGIYDREYYRREGTSFLDSFTGRGQVCKWLIGINIAVFILQLLTQYRDYWGEIHAPLTDALLLNVKDVLHGQVWRLLTYAFLHDPFSLGHILFNMLFLWWFGSDVEDIYGPREFLAFYLLSAFLGGVVFELAWLTGVTPFATKCLGASGAVTAVMVLCALHYPTRVILLFFFIPVPIWLFVVFQVAQDLFGLLGGHEGVAFTVHLAGAGFAYAYYKMGWRVMDWVPNLRGRMKQRARPSLRVFREEEEEEPVERARAPVAAAPTPAADADDQLEAKLDAVLEKVARSGKDSLTESERQILLRASEVYKRRRT
jgi:membrane associated rhomboid family serine protease